MAVLRITTDGGNTWVPLTVGQRGLQGPQGPTGPQGPPGGSVSIEGNVSSSSQLPLGVGIGKGYLTNDTGHLWVKTAEPNTWNDVGEIRGPQGIPGEITQAVGDSRYVRSAGGTVNNGLALGTFTVKAPAGNHGAKYSVLSTGVPIELAALDASGEKADNKITFDAVTQQWRMGATAFGDAVSGTSLALSGKAMSQGTTIGDDSGTLTTKSYVDALLPVGTIIAFSGAVPPNNNWHLCDGSVHGSAALKALLKASWLAQGLSDSAADAAATKTPDLRGKFVLASGAGTGLTARKPHDTGGKEKHQLSAAEMPSHAHTTDPVDNHAHTGHQAGAHTHTTSMPWKAFKQADSAGSGVEGTNPTSAWGSVMLQGSTSDPGNHSHGMDGAGGHSHTVKPAGDGEKHENMPPFYALTYIVRK